MEDVGKGQGGRKEDDRRVGERRMIGRVGGRRRSS